MSRTRMPQAVALFVALTIAAATPAHAQFGGLVKKAKQAAAGAAEAKIDDKAGITTSSGVKPSSAFGEELTEETFKSLLRGLNVELTKAVRRDALRADADSARETRVRISNAHHDEGNRYTKQQDVTADCRSAAEEKNEERRKEEVISEKTGLGMTQANQQKMLEFHQRHEAAKNKAEKAHDKAAMAKADADFQRDMLAYLAGDTAGDSAKVAKQCPSPVKPAWMVQADALAAREDTLSVQIRALDEQLVSAGAAAAGMTATQFALAKERVINWAEKEIENHSEIQQFRDAERRMFEAHKAEIRKVRRVLVPS